MYSCRGPIEGITRRSPRRWRVELSLPCIARFELMLNRVMDADLVDGPFRCDGDCPIGLAGKPVNRDPGIEPLKKIDDKRDILLLREQRKYARAVILLQHGIPDHVEIVQFDPVDTEPIQE